MVEQKSWDIRQGENRSREISVPSRTVLVGTVALVAGVVVGFFALIAGPGMSDAAEVALRSVATFLVCAGATAAALGALYRCLR